MNFTDELFSKLNAHANTVNHSPWDTVDPLKQTSTQHFEHMTPFDSTATMSSTLPPGLSSSTQQYQGYPMGLYNNPISPKFRPQTSALSPVLGQFNAFHLPLELQGGVSNISSRRPSYAAEFYNRNTERQNQFQSVDLLEPIPFNLNGSAFARPQSHQQESFIQLDNGLLLQGQYIITSLELKKKFHEVRSYFGDIDVSTKIYEELTRLVDFNNPNHSEVEKLLVSKVYQLITYLKSKNEDLKFQTKNYTLILNKNNKLDIISIPKNSNLRLFKEDLIIVEGDRGKDLVMVLEPIIPLNVAILFNYLKKKLHLKSLSYAQETDKPPQPPHPSKNSSIINEDENFVTLPNKQILRFVKPFEIQQLSLKYNDEIMAHRLCLQYASNLNLNLEIKNVEFQFDKKKLIIYYYCPKRLDFRGLIKELFKVYKTRIWLCAILPIEKSPKLNKDDPTPVIKDNFPKEIANSEELNYTEPIYFHGKIFYNLVKMFELELLDDKN